MAFDGPRTPPRESGDNEDIGDKSRIALNVRWVVACVHRRSVGAAAPPELAARHKPQPPRHDRDDGDAGGGERRVGSGCAVRGWERGDGKQCRNLSGEQQLDPVEFNRELEAHIRGVIRSPSLDDRRHIEVQQTSSRIAFACEKVRWIEPPVAAGTH